MRTCRSELLCGVRVPLAEYDHGWPSLERRAGGDGVVVHRVEGCRRKLAARLIHLSAPGGVRVGVIVVGGSTRRVQEDGPGKLSH
jgi:hypothetical protein